MSIYEYKIQNRNGDYELPLYTYIKNEIKEDMEEDIKKII